MKRTFKRHDGSEETLEGTPEELAQHERMMTGEPSVKEPEKKPEVLRGTELSELAEFIRQFKSDFYRSPKPSDFMQPTPITMCGTCFGYPCMCAKITFTTMCDV